MATPAFGGVEVVNGTGAISVPSGAEVGDALLAMIYNRSSQGANPVVPAGTTWIEQFDAGDLLVFSKLVEEDEPSSYSFAPGAPSAIQMLALYKHVLVPGYGLGDFYDGDASDGSYGGDPTVCPDLSTTKDHCRIIRVICSSSISANWDMVEGEEPVGTTFRAGVEEGGSMMFADEDAPEAGAVGSASFQFTSGVNWSVATIALAGLPFTRRSHASGMLT